MIKLMNKRGFSIPLLLFLLPVVIILLIFLYRYFSYQLDERYVYSVAKKLGYNQNTQINFNHNSSFYSDVISTKFKTDTDKDFDDFFTLINNLPFTIYQYYNFSGRPKWVIWDRGRYLEVEYLDGSIVEIVLDRRSKSPKQKLDYEEMPLAWERYINEDFNYSIKLPGGLVPYPSNDSRIVRFGTRTFVPDDVSDYGIHFLIAENPQNLSLVNWFQSDEAKKYNIIFNEQSDLSGMDAQANDRTWINVEKNNILIKYFLPTNKVLWVTLNKGRVILLTFPSEDWDKFGNHHKYDLYYMLKTFKYL